MRNITTPLADAIKSLIETMNTTRTAIYTEANTRKAALAKAVADMVEARNTMTDFVDAMEMLTDAAEEFGTDIKVSTENVTAMVFDMDVFTLPIEKFDGYCDDCGKELSRDEIQYLDEDHDGFVCEACDKRNHPEAEIGEQMTIINEEEA